MCGRYTVATPDAGGIRARFGLDERVEVRRRFNIAPGDDVLAVLGDGDGALLRWGLVPHWGADPGAFGARTINARVETVAERPTYRDAFARRRCLVVADGFYEWAQGAPHWITREDGAPFAFAGLWDSWQPREDVEPLRSCAILTTAARGRLSALHPRVPVILPPDGEGAWLDPATPPPALRRLARPGAAMTFRVVGRAVNDARHDAPDCLDPPVQAALF